MKVINISILDDLKEIDIENDNVDVSVKTDEPYTYVLSVATPQHLQFLINKDKRGYAKPGYPFILVNKLTPEIIEEALKAFAEEDGGYWLKIYYFGGSIGIIDESTFDRLKAKRNEELNELPDIGDMDELELDELLEEFNGLLDEFNDQKNP